MSNDIKLDANGEPYKYQHTVYAKGWAIKVNPPERSHEVMHYLMTGGLLGGRSLDGVTWEEVEPDNSAAKALGRAMEITESSERI